MQLTYGHSYSLCIIMYVNITYITQVKYCIIASSRNIPLGAETIDIVYKITFTWFDVFQ